MRFLYDNNQRKQGGPGYQKWPQEIVSFYGHNSNWNDSKNISLRDCITSNKVNIKNREMRFSKWILGLVTQAQYEEALGYLREKNYFDQLRGKAKESIEALVTQMVEDGQNTQRRVMITANPLDILLSATCAGYRSCHALDGEWASGNVGYTQTPFVFMIAMLQPHPVTFPFMKISRMFGYLKMPEANRFVLARAYGTFGQAQLDQINSMLTEILAERISPDTDSKWISATGGSFGGQSYDMSLISYAGKDSHEMPRPIYFDHAVSMVTAQDTENLQMMIENYRNRSGRAKAGVREIFHAIEYGMQFPRTPCTACGKNHEHGYSLVCESCIRKAPRCQGGHCGQVYIHTPARPGVSAELNGQVLCMTCFDRNAFTCHECTKVFDRRTKYETFNVPVAAASAEKLDLGVLKSSERSGGPGSSPKRKETTMQIHFCAGCVPKVVQACDYCDKNDLKRSMRSILNLNHLDKAGAAASVLICPKCDLGHNCTDCGPEKWYGRVYTELNQNGQVVARRCTAHQNAVTMSGLAAVGAPEQTA